jgi:hypothetical protein
MGIIDQATKPGPRPIVATILGDAGMGKTSLAATFPNPIVVRAEDGVQGVPDELKPDALPPLQSVDALWEQLTALCREDHGYKTVVIDSITQLEQMFVQWVVENDPKKPRTINQANGGYGAGWQAVGGMHQRVRKAAGALVEKGCHVVFLAHADTTTVEPPDGDPYTRYDLRLNKRSVAPYTDNVDVVGYLRLQTYTHGEEGQRKKAISDGSRVLVTYATPNNISKNRYGIETDLPVGKGENPLYQYIASLNEE